MTSEWNNDRGRKDIVGNVCHVSQWFLKKLFVLYPIHMFYFQVIIIATFAAIAFGFLVIVSLWLLRRYRRKRKIFAVEFTLQLQFIPT